MEAPGDLSLDFSALRTAYRAGSLTPSSLVDLLVRRMARTGQEGIWIRARTEDEMAADAYAIEQRNRGGQHLPLYGIPFAVKDNIDVAGLPTTAGCAAYAYTPAASATVVRKLIEAGALLVGKTNMDQFATGLVGVRSPYGIPTNPFDARYITGGSSSGSAAAVARGLCSFALGTDTAGSGRVPAAFTNIVGLKPSCGVVSAAGVVPACRSLDCVSVFALTCDDAGAVANVARGYDPADPYYRPDAGDISWSAAPPPPVFKFGVPVAPDLDFLGDREAERLFREAVARLESLGGRPVTLDLKPFREAARLLYEGPWVAERLAALEKIMVENPEAVLPVTRQIVSGGARFNAVDTFRALYRLEEIRHIARATWKNIDVLLLPTTPTIYKIEEILADPIRLNSNLGLYTNFVNLLDLSAIAVPGGFRADGLPLGVTFIGPRGADGALAALGGAFHQRLGGTLGATGHPLPALPATTSAASPNTRPAPSPSIRVAVAGAHLTGQPLNHELTNLGARLVRTTKTASHYRLYALPGTTPPKPGLLRARGREGRPIEIEIWEMARTAFGAYFASVLPPLCMGTVETEDGEKVPGFLCESYATVGARDISEFGGWRAYLAAPK